MSFFETMKSSFPGDTFTKEEKRAAYVAGAVLVATTVLVLSPAIFFLSALFTALTFALMYPQKAKQLAQDLADALAEAKTSFSKS